MFDLRAAMKRLMIAATDGPRLRAPVLHRRSCHASEALIAQFMGGEGLSCGKSEAISASVIPAHAGIRIGRRRRRNAG